MMEPKLSQLAGRPDSRDEAPPRLDLNLLEVFDTVMTERHVTRAAERLGMTQSAVSNALNRLRLRFHDQLFVKAPRGVEPTPKALAMYPRIHRAIAELHATVEPRYFDAANASQRFRIAMVDITASLIAPPLLRRMAAMAPRSNLFFVPHDPATTGHLLMRGYLDFAFVIEPIRASVIQCAPLWTDRFVVAARRGHPLFEGCFSLTRFCDTPQLEVNEPGDEEAPNPIDEALTNQGLARQVSLWVNQFSVVPGILSSSDLVAVLPARFATAPPFRNVLEVRPLPFSVPEIVISLCWHQRSNEAPANLWLKQQLLEAVAALTFERPLP